MATPNRATQGKRERERAAKEKKADKLDKRNFRKEQKKTRAEGMGGDDGFDPDLAGIVAGPQPQLVD